MNPFTATTTATYNVQIVHPVTGKVKEEQWTTTYNLPWTVANKKFEDGTPECMKFVYGMFKAKCSVVNIPENKMQLVKEHFVCLQDFDPHHKYTFNESDAQLVKEEREIKILTGEMADLENEFIKNKTIAKEDRLFVIRIFDHVKRGYTDEKEIIERLRQIIRPQQTLF